MLAGCSSTLLSSPRHRLRSEASTQFQACHFPSMSSTQRLDLPCSFARKDTSRSQAIRPVGLSVEKPIEAKTSGCSLKQSIRRPPSPTTAQTSFNEGRIGSSIDEFWEKQKSLKKRYAEQGSFDDEGCMNRAKRKKGNGKSDTFHEEGEDLKLGQLGNGSFWLQSGFDVPCSVPLIPGLNSPQLPFSLTCSGEEERVCFVPSDVIPPPLPPLSQSPWVESIGTEIADLGEKNAETSVREATASSVSSESHGVILRMNENPSEVEVGNGSRLPNPHESAEVVVARHNGQNHHHEENNGLELVSLLVACVEAVGSKNVSGISNFLARLGERASPRGSTIQRIIAYFTEALALRVARIWPHIFHITPPRELDRSIDDDHGTALRLLNQVSPVPKFLHFTSNEIILRAFEGKDRVHIIDFDIKQGLQWPSLFQSLASRPNPPGLVRITGVGESKQELIETGGRLAGFAEALSLPFEFHPVVDRLEDVRLWMLHVKERETVAVNCIFQMHKMLYDRTGGALRDFLGLIRSTKPSVVLLAEQEAEINDPTLGTRLGNALQYYSAIFDSVDSSLPLDSPVRIKIEEMFAREIRNIVACEGRDRFERYESFAKWRAMMEQGSFRCIGTTEREFLQGQMLLRIYSGENFQVEMQGQDRAALTLSYSDQPLFTVSAWAPVDIAGSSSSYSQPS